LWFSDAVVSRATSIVGWSAAVALVASALTADEIGPAGWREDFRTYPAGWEIRPKSGVKVAEFRVEPTADGGRALRMTADNASAMLATHLGHVDLRRTPILRWRWRATTLPIGGDGRIPERDDQAIGVYISSGGWLRQKSIAYRWETDTPVGAEGETSYAAGIVKTKWIALRNAGDAGEFFTEERNAAQDFLRLFGFVPDDVSVGVVCNSQYTGTAAVAELDWIELVAAPAPPADDAEEK